MAGFNHKLVVVLCGALLAVAGASAVGETRQAQCIDCHVGSVDPAIKRLARTVHGNLPGDDNASCISCHGASEAHMQAPVKISPDISFGPNWPSGPELRSASCLSCHEERSHVLWTGSAHQQENLACDNCHNAHEPKDLALDKREAEQLCLSCHPRVRAEMNLPSRHPIAEGKTACSDCHNPHGGLGESGLHQLTVNDNCLSCHQEMRGPFLWEHPPAAEDCALCHRPHGSVHDRLLTARGPALCQQCHAAAFHPSLPYGSEGLPGGTPNQNLLGKNCLNCHSQVHGSNHPSGARLTR
jgi:DmsE family decaheme c-type cytochrome